MSGAPAHPAGSTRGPEAPGDAGLGAAGTVRGSRVMRRPSREPGAEVMVPLCPQRRGPPRVAARWGSQPLCSSTAARWETRPSGQRGWGAPSSPEGLLGCRGRWSEVHTRPRWGWGGSWPCHSPAGPGIAGGASPLPPSAGTGRRGRGWERLTSSPFQPQPFRKLLQREQTGSPETVVKTGPLSPTWGQQAAGVRLLFGLLHGPQSSAGKWVFLLVGGPASQAGLGHAVPGSCAAVSGRHGQGRLPTPRRPGPSPGFSAAGYSCFLSRASSKFTLPHNFR